MADETLTLKMEADIGDLSSDTKKARRDVETFADKSENALDDFERAMRDAKSTATTAMAGVAAAFAGVTVGIAGIVESSMEFRSETARVVAAFEGVGGSAEDATSTFEDFYVLLGDTDAASEATQLLSQITTDSKELNEWVHAVTGSWASFGKSIPLESLIEAANEAINTGEAVGALADYITWVDWSNIDVSVVFGGNQEAIAEFQRVLAETNDPVQAFNAALKKLTTTEERANAIQRLMNEGTGAAADKYKASTRAMEEYRRAQNRWETAVSGIASALTPAMTALLNFGAAILEDMKTPIEDVSDFIVDDFVPALDSIYTWCKNNGDVVSAAISAIVGAFAGLKSYAIILGLTSVTQALNNTGTAVLAVGGRMAKAVKTGNGATTMFGMLGAAVSKIPHPFALAAAAAIGVGSAIAGFALATEDGWEATQHLTDEQLELIRTSAALGDEWDAMMDSYVENESFYTTQQQYYQSLAQELMTLADANGHVQEKDRARVNFILHELSQAYGKEYQLVGNQIQGYGELAKSIQGVINAKTAELLLGAREETYVQAIQNEAAAWDAFTLAKADYDAQAALVAQKEEERAAAWASYNEAYQQWVDSGYDETVHREVTIRAQRAAALDTELANEKSVLAEKKLAYDNAAADYGQYQNEIATYEEASAALLEGNVDKALQLLTTEKAGWANYTSDVTSEYQANIDALERMAVDTGIEAERVRTNFESGVDGYTEEMVEEARAAHEESVAELQKAVLEAHQAGVDVGYGFSDGTTAADVLATVRSRATSLVSTAIAAMRAAADSHSPSRKTMALGNDVGEGLEIGMDEKAQDVAASASRMIQEAIVPIDTNIRSVSYTDFADSFGTSLGSLSYSNNRMAEALINTMVGRRNSNTPIILQVDGKVFAQTSIDSINKLTRQTGSLGLQLV